MQWIEIENERPTGAVVLFAGQIYMYEHNDLRWYYDIGYLNEVEMYFNRQGTWIHLNTGGTKRFESYSHWRTLDIPDTPSVLQREVDFAIVWKELRNNMDFIPGEISEELTKALRIK